MAVIHENAPASIMVTDSGITTSLKLQPLNASYCTMVTEFGMIIFFRPLQPSKDLGPIIVTLEGITVLLHPVINLLLLVSIIALQPFRES